MTLRFSNTRKPSNRLYTSVPCLLILGALLTMGSWVHAEPRLTETASCQDWQNQSLGKLHSSKSIELCELMLNKPVLVVNTASHCGFTRQFKGLETLHQKYKDRGLVVIGFPSNDFNQEAKNEAAIADVCYKNYGVTFAMTDPVSVRGSSAIPLFKHLAEETQAPNWNFNKYLIDRNGRVTHYFSSTTEPGSSSLESAIEQVL